MLEATLYGVVQDSSGAILPGVTVTVTHQGTTLTRETVSDARGEFALPALPPGAYTIKIELSGFKTYENEGLTLSAGQTVRQTFALEVGALAETVTVAENAPLIETATTAQVQSLGEEVREIPVSRRNLQNVILLGSGVSSTDSVSWRAAGRSASTASATAAAPSRWTAAAPRRTRKIAASAITAARTRSRS